MKHLIFPSSRIRIPDSVLSHNLQGEEIILNLNTGVYWGLNPVGTRAWQLLSEQRCLSAILKTMREEYDVAEERLRQDLLDLVARLADKGLVEVVGETVD